MTASTVLYFLGASVALTLAPGPDNLFVMTQGITRGRKPAIITALGMCSGVTVHTIAAAFGLSAIFYTSALAFNLVKYAGVAYLLYLAYRAIKDRSSISFAAADDSPPAALFKRGFIMNVLNPKVAMFFLAFLPQFVTPDTRYVTMHILLLGAIFMIQAVVIFCLIGYFAGTIGSYLLARPKLAKYFDCLTAGVFASLGIRLALVER